MQQLPDREDEQELRGREVAEREQLALDHRAVDPGPPRDDRADEERDHEQRRCHAPEEQAAPGERRLPLRRGIPGGARTILRCKRMPVRRRLATGDVRGEWEQEREPSNHVSAGLPDAIRPATPGEVIPGFLFPFLFLSHALLLVSEAP